MMTDTLFEKLIQSPESDVLDFKRKSLDFSFNKEVEDAKFVKDILSFSNTIRQDTAYILYGIDESNGIKNLLGIDDFPDDAVLQQKIKDKISPVAKFRSFIYVYNNLKFGIIEIPVSPYSEPISSVVKLKSLEVGKIYIRRGSSNAEASGREVIAVSKWMEALHVEQKSVDLFDNQLGEVARSLADSSQPLSTSLSTCLGVAVKLNNTAFQKFCYHELTGYKNDYQSYLELAEHRIISVVATPLTVTLQPYISLKGDALLRYMLEQEHFSEERFFFDRSINELEANISLLSEKQDQALATYEISDKVLYPNSDRPNGKITLYMALSTFKTVYEKIRKTAIKYLLDSRP